MLYLCGLATMCDFISGFFCTFFFRFCTKSACFYIFLLSFYLKRSPFNTKEDRFDIEKFQIHTKRTWKDTKTRCFYIKPEQECIKRDPFSSLLVRDDRIARLISQVFQIKYTCCISFAVCAILCCRDNTLSRILDTWRKEKYGL